MNEMRYKLGIRLEMLHKSIVYDLYEIRWQQVVTPQSSFYLHCESKSLLVLV